MAWDDLRLGRFQRRRSVPWIAISSAFIAGLGLGYTLGTRGAPFLEEPAIEQAPEVHVIAPKAPRSPLLQALHDSEPVRRCFTLHGSRDDAHRHDVIEFALVIEPDGSVQSASVHARNHPALKSCLMQAAGATRFPRQRMKREVGLHTEMGGWF